MLPINRKRKWCRAAWGGLLAGAACSRPVAAQRHPAPAPTQLPALAQVRQAYTQAHPPRRPNCAPENLFFSLEVPQNVVACRPDEAALTCYYRGRATSLDQEQYGRDNYHFTVLHGGRAAGTLLVQPFGTPNPAAFDLLPQASLRAALGGLPATRFWAMGDTGFARAVRRVLTGKPPGLAPACFAAPTLNDKGYALPQLGCPVEALLVFNEVLRRYPTRAVAYLNRGDAYWRLGQPGAAQADYRRYLALLRAQQKDTTRVPAYVRLAVRLPAQPR